MNMLHALAFLTLSQSVLFSQLDSIRFTHDSPINANLQPMKYGYGLGPEDSMMMEEVVCPKILWVGSDPFHQPRNTTNYYGSGDLNLDGLVNNDDLAIVNTMIGNAHPGRIEADVNADGRINQDDTLLIQNHIQTNEPLPGHWDRLASKEARIDWIRRVLKLDDTDQYPYHSNWVCVHFERELTIRFSGFRRDLTHTPHSGGQAIYNLPLYVAGTPGHAINAILVGDNPLDFNDWYLIEPQNDERITRAGVWNFEYGELHIGSASGTSWIEFRGSESGVELVSYHRELTLTRFDNPIPKYPSVQDMYRPQFVRGSSDMIVMRSQQNNLSRWTKPFLTTTALYNHTHQPLLGEIKHSVRPLDQILTPDNQLHLLWSRQANTQALIDQPILYHSIVDPTTTQTLGAFVIGVPQRGRLLPSAKLVYDCRGKVHVIWLEKNYDTALSKLVHSQYTPETGKWSTPSSIYEFTYLDTGVEYFDAAPYLNGIILLTAGSTMEYQKDDKGNVTYYNFSATVAQSRYFDGSNWTQPSLASSCAYHDQAAGIKCHVDSNNSVHSILWTHKPWDEYHNLIYSKSANGFSWEPQQVVNTGGTENFCLDADITTIPSGEALVASIEAPLIHPKYRLSPAIPPVIRVYKHNGKKWNVVTEMGRRGHDLSSIDLATRPDGSTIALWTELREDLAETQIMPINL